MRQDVPRRGAPGGLSGRVGRRRMGKRILVVESGMPVVPFEQSLLLRKEHELFRASTGSEALEKVEKSCPSS